MLRVDEDHHKSPGVHLPSPYPTSSFWHNEPSSFLLHHRTTPKLPEKADVIIIGSGISGAFAAMRLLKEQGLNVLMLDAREACWGATGRNGGHCQPHLYSNALAVAAFELRNFYAIEALIQKYDIPCEWTRMHGGGCHAYFTREYFDEAKREVEYLQQMAPKMGATVRVVEDSADLANLKVPTAVGAIVQAVAAKLSPYKLVCWILEYLIKSSGLNLQTSTPVLSLRCLDGPGSALRWKVCTSRGVVEASHVLTTTNAYTSYLVPQFQSLIVPVRGEMSALRTPAPLMKRPLTHTYAFIGTLGQHRKQDDYLVQRPVTNSSTDDGGELMFGGGRMKAFHEGVNVDSDDTIDAPVAEYLRGHLTQVLDMKKNPDESTENHDREKDLTAKKEWTGIMGFSRDGHPWVGGIPDVPGLWMSAAFSGSGMPNAALSAEHTATLILSMYKGYDWKATEEAAVRIGSIPLCYTISRERMERARSLPDIV